MLSSTVLKPSLGPCRLLVCLANSVAVVSHWLFGRPLRPLSEHLLAWSANFEATTNSPRRLDLSSFMHGTFGAGLCLFLDWPKPICLSRSGLVVAVLGSVVREILKDTRRVIRLFNLSAQLEAYVGDRIVNSPADAGFVIVGFLSRGYSAGE